MSKNEFLINEEIKEKEVRLIGPDGTMIGVVSTKEALTIASSSDLDLVMIASQASPPVCKVMDHGKYLFELSKKEKEAKKNQKVISVKEIRISASIEDHDFNFKVKNACTFLKEGNRVKVFVKFKGREISYAEKGKEVLANFADSCKEAAIMEKSPKLEGRSMSMILSPKS